MHEESPERLEFYGGTEEYSAPELILAEDYSTLSDVFSLGLTYVCLKPTMAVPWPYAGSTPHLLCSLPPPRTRTHPTTDPLLAASESRRYAEMMSQCQVGKNGFLERGPRELFALDGDAVRDAIYASEGAQVDEPPASFVELAVQCVEYEPADRPPIKEVSVGFELRAHSSGLRLGFNPSSDPNLDRPTPTSKPNLELEPISILTPIRPQLRPNPKRNLNLQVLEWLEELLNDPDFNLDGDEEVR